MTNQTDYFNKVVCLVHFYSWNLTKKNSLKNKRGSDKTLNFTVNFKTTRTYQENELLSGYFMDLQTFDKVLVKAQKTGKITIEKNMITDIESATFEI